MWKSLEHKAAVEFMGIPRRGDRDMIEHEVMEREDMLRFASHEGGLLPPVYSHHVGVVAQTPNLVGLRRGRAHRIAEIYPEGIPTKCPFREVVPLRVDPGAMHGPADRPVEANSGATESTPEADPTYPSGECMCSQEALELLHESWHLGRDRRIRCLLCERIVAYTDGSAANRQSRCLASARKWRTPLLPTLAVVKHQRWRFA